MLTKGAIGNLVNRYRAVLRKCRLINAFGSLAIASMLVAGVAGSAGATTLADLEKDAEGAYLITSSIRLGTSTSRTVLDAGVIKVREKGSLTISGGANSSISGDIKIDGKATISLKSGSIIDGQIVVGASAEPVKTAPSLSLTGPITMSGQSGTDGGAVTVNQVAMSFGTSSFLMGPKVSLSGLTFTMNSASNCGGAIYSKSSQTIVSNAVFGGLDADGKVDASKGNTAGSKGGALYASQTLKLSNSQCYGNSAQYGGALWNQGTGTKISSTVFQGNTASSSGGAVYSKTKLDVLDGNTFADNHAKGGSGGALFVSGGLTVTANASGVSSFTGNSATGGEMYEPSRGGAIYNNSDVAPSEIANAVFAGNSAEAGGAVYYTGLGLALRDSSFSGNTATGDGGAFYYEDGFQSESGLTLSNVTFSNNRADGRGGALYIDNSCDRAVVNFLGTNVFSGNTAGNAANDVYSEGGVNVIDGTTSMEALTMNGGLLTVDTGTLRVSQSAQLSVENGKALDVKYNGSADLTGNVTITARSESAVCAAEVADGAALTLGSEGKTVNLTASSTEGDACAVHVTGQSGDVTVDGKADIGVSSQRNATGIRLSGNEAHASFKGDVAISASGTEGACGLHISESALANIHGAVSLAAASEANSAHALYGGGTLINAGSFTVRSGLLSGFTGSYTQTAGSTDLTKAADFFGGGVSIEGGSLTVDAGQLTAGSAFVSALASRADFASGAALNVDFAHLATTSYTLSDYFKARDALIADDEGRLVFLNATLERSDDDTILLGQSGGVVASSGIVFAAKGHQSYAEAAVAEPSQQFNAAAGDMVTLADADSINHVNTARSVAFGSSLTAQGLHVGQMTELTVNSGAALQFAATGEKLFVGADGSEAAVSVTVNSGASFALGMAGQEGAQYATLGDVTVDGPSALDTDTTLAGGRFELGNGTSNARYRFGDVVVNGFLSVHGNGIATTSIACESHAANGEVSIQDAAFSASSRIDVRGVFSAEGSAVVAPIFSSTGLTSFKNSSVTADTFTVSGGATALDGVGGKIGQFSVEAGEAVLSRVDDVLERLDLSGDSVVSLTDSAVGAVTAEGGRLSLVNSTVSGLRVSEADVSIDASSVTGPADVLGGRFSAVNGSVLGGLSVGDAEVVLDASSVTGQTFVDSGKLTAVRAVLADFALASGEASLTESRITGAVSVTGGSLDVAGNTLEFKNNITAGEADPAGQGSSAVRIHATGDLTIIGDVANHAAPEAAPSRTIALAAGNTLKISGGVENSGELTIEGVTVELSADAGRSALCGSGTTTLTADTVTLRASSFPAVVASGDVLLTARKTGTISGGITIGEQGALALNGDFTLSGDVTSAADGGSFINAGQLHFASGTVTGFKGLFSQSAGSTTLTRENGFFGGRVALSGGEMTAHTVRPVNDMTVSDRARLRVENALDLSTGSLIVSGGSVDAAGASITEGRGALVLNGESSFTADADEVLSFTLAEQDGRTVLDGSVTAAGRMGTTLDALQGTVNLDFGTAFVYTLDQYKAAEQALFDRTTEKAVLSFLNGELSIGREGGVLIGATTESTVDAETGKTITKVLLAPAAVPTLGTEGTALDSTPEEHGDETAFYDHVVKIVDSSDPAHTALDVEEVHAEGPGFHAGALEVGRGSGEARGSVLLSVDGRDSEGGALLLSGTNKGLLVAENAEGELEAVKAGVAVDEHSSFTIGLGKGVQAEIRGELETADIRGAHLVNGNGADKTRVTYGEMQIGRGANIDSKGGETRILHASAHIGRLDIHRGRFFIDPAYAKIDSLGTLDGEFIVGSGSVAVIGDVADLAEHVEKAGMTTHAAGEGFTVDSRRAVLALGQSVAIGDFGKLTVDGGLKSADVELRASGTGKGDAEFAADSLLVVDSRLAEKGPVLTGLGKLTVSKEAVLYLVDARAGTDYSFAEFSGGAFSEGADGSLTKDASWEKVLTNAFTNAVLVSEGGKVYVLIKAVPLDTALPGVEPVSALMELGEIGSEVDADDTGTVKPGKKFLSRAIDPTCIADTAKAVAAINEVACAVAVAGVQNTALRIADAASDAVRDRLSMAGRTASVQNGGATFWAAPMYGDLYTHGMATDGSSVRGQFGGLALGADLESGEFHGGRLSTGAFVYGGGGQSEADAIATVAENDYDFGGLSLYAGWKSGAFNVIGSVGYGFGSHEVSMGLPASMAMGMARTDVDTSAFTADLRVEYQLSTAWADILPHVGVRGTVLRTDSHELKVGGEVLSRVESDTQNIVQIPIGVTLSKDFAFADWRVKPAVDLSVIPAAGDTKAESRVNFSGLSTWDSVNSRIMDSTSWAGRIGVQAENGRLSVGLNYGVLASSRETDQNVQVRLGWKF